MAEIENSVTEQTNSSTESEVTQTEGIRLRAVTSDLSRKDVIGKIVSRLERSQKPIHQALAPILLERAKGLQTRFLAALDKRTTLKRSQRNDLSSVTGKYDSLLSKIRDFWSILKIHFRDHAQASDIYQNFGLTKEGYRPTSYRRTDICDYAEKILKAKTLSLEEGLVLPSENILTDIENQLAMIKNNEDENLELHYEQAESVENLVNLRIELKDFFKETRARLRSMLTDKEPKMVRHIHRSLGFSYIGAESDAAPDEEPYVESTPILIDDAPTAESGETV